MIERVSAICYMCCVCVCVCCVCVCMCVCVHKHTLIDTQVMCVTARTRYKTSHIILYLVLIDLNRSSEVSATYGCPAAFIHCRGAAVG